MSLSKQARIDNMLLALNLMLNELGDNPYDFLFANANAIEYEAIESTTWKELIDQGLIKNVKSTASMFFTGRGWRTIVMHLKLHEEEEFRGHLSKLSAALKAHVKGRQKPAIVDVHTLSRDTDLPLSFILNVLQSHMIDHVFKIKGARVSDRIVVEIPLDYGLTPL